MRKRVAVIHDLASYGGAALMNIIPIMYCKGIEVNPIPTVLFTSHGGFKGAKQESNTEFIDEYTAQWSKLNLRFNGIYLGLFTDNLQILSALKFIANFDKDDSFIVLDPILGDNGKLYGFMDTSIIAGVRTLASKADVITPNLTEACLLSNREYKEDMTVSEILSLLRDLAGLGPERIILTSVPKADSLATYIYFKATDSYDVVTRKKLPGSYPGTGDAFTSVVMAEILNGADIVDAVKKAADFVEKGISIILKNGLNPLEGLPLGEQTLLQSL